MVVTRVATGVAKAQGDWGPQGAQGAAGAARGVRVQGIHGVPGTAGSIGPIGPIGAAGANRANRSMETMGKGSTELPGRGPERTEQRQLREPLGRSALPALRAPPVQPAL